MLLVLKKREQTATASFIFSPLLRTVVQNVYKFVSSFLRLMKYLSHEENSSTTTKRQR